jgi:hypothetical protein
VELPRGFEIKVQKAVLKFFSIKSWFMLEGVYKNQLLFQKFNENFSGKRHLYQHFSLFSSITIFPGHQFFYGVLKYCNANDESLPHFLALKFVSSWIWPEYLGG